MNYIEKARKFRKAMLNIAPTLEDAQASTVPEMFPRLKGDGSPISAGVRINWNSTIKKAAVALWDTPENDPDHAPNLWEDICYREGFRMIPEIITAALAFSEGECGWWNERLYRSKVNDNIYTPGQYPENWEELEAK